MIKQIKKDVNDLTDRDFKLILAALGMAVSLLLFMSAIVMKLVLE